MILIILYCISFLYYSTDVVSSATYLKDQNTKEKHRTVVLDCEELGTCEDQLGLDAIRYLHRQLDDDANGNVDVAESDDFLRDELQYESGYERQKVFHGSDKHISVDELWRSWKVSEVHNWTVEETVQWLVAYVDLPQYAQTFRDNAVDGSALPRMAANDVNFMMSVLGIKDAINRQKLALKAMDVVLFGPQRYHNYIKDSFLVLSLVVAIVGYWFAYVQQKYSKTHLQKMMKDMESLQNAEEALLKLQKELDKARQEQEIVAIEKENLERMLKDEIGAPRKQEEDIDNEDVDRLHQLEEELEHTREELREAEKAIELRSLAPPLALQHWLQLTHELELRHYSAKKAAAEHQLSAAKEGCEKLRKKRSSFMGTFRIAHGSVLDDVDDKILQAKAALSEVTQDLQERLNRWKQIELLCNFQIVCNPGLRHLEMLLLGSTSHVNSVRSCFTEESIHRSGSEATLLEDATTSVYGNVGSEAGNAPAGPFHAFTWPYIGFDTRKDSSVSQPTLLAIGTVASERRYPPLVKVGVLGSVTAIDQIDFPSEQDDDEEMYHEDVKSLNGSITLSLAPSIGFAESENPYSNLGKSLQDIQPGPVMKSMSLDSHLLGFPEASHTLTRHTASDSRLDDHEHSTLSRSLPLHHSTDAVNQGSLERLRKSDSLKNAAEDKKNVEEEKKERRKKSFFTDLVKKKPKAL